MLQRGYDTIAPQTNEEKIMVFTSTKLAPLNVFDYKLERLLNFMRRNDYSENHIQSIKREFKILRNKIYVNAVLTDNEQSRLEILNNVM